MKKPLYSIQYEEGLPDNLSESGMQYAACLGINDYSQIDDADARRLLDETHKLKLQEVLQWIEDNKKNFAPTTAVIDLHCDSLDKLRQAYKPKSKYCIIVKRPLNTIPDLDNFLNGCNEILCNNGYLLTHSRTAVLKKASIMHHFPPVLRHIAATLHFLWHRVCPKLRITKKIYFGITRGVNRTYNRIELLGRTFRAGFEVLDEDFRFNHYYIFSRYTKEPIWNDTPSERPIIKLNRIGKDGAIIGVYKFRTMYAYSEYIQNYIYSNNKLQSGGKFANDYRVSYIGHLLRSVWLDELPMIINVLKGQMKLVGVRPLSRHYFNLYSTDMQQLRTKVKPGLIPPFYYERQSPSTLEEVQESERRYIEAYLKNPFATDWRYFWGTIANILFHHKHSK